jgi:hypothetical protein
MQSDVEQPAGSAGLNLRHACNGRRIEITIAENPQLPGPLRDQHVPIRKPRHAPRMGESFCHHGNTNARSALGGRVRPRTVADGVCASLGECNDRNQQKQGSENGSFHERGG